VPGAAEVLHTLRKQNHPWAIVTSAWRKLAETRVIAAGLPLPKVIVPVDEIRNGKPDPVGLLTTHSAQQLRHQPLIGDFRDVAIRPEGGFLKIELTDQSQRGVERGPGLHVEGALGTRQESAVKYPGK
jgi:sugar-phosphatase